MNLIVLLLTLTLAAGCASVTATPNTASSEDQERQVQKLLIGTWSGYIKDPRGVTLIFNTPTRQIANLIKEFFHK